MRGNWLDTSADIVDEAMGGTHLLSSLIPLPLTQSRRCSCTYRS